MAVSGGKIATLAGLGIAAAGALFAGIQSWPVITGTNNSVPASSQKAEQSGGTTNCANIQGGAGIIDCRTISTPNKPDVPELEFTVERSLKDKNAIVFLQSNLDKVIRIKAHIPSNETFDYGDSTFITLGCNPNDFSYDECPAASITIAKYCSSNPKLPCLLNENGGYVLDGYFTALANGEKAGYFGVILRNVSPEDVRLR